MSTREQLRTRLLKQGHQVDDSSDKVNSISSWLLRHVEGDTLVMTAGGDGDPKKRVNALVHALALADSMPDVSAIEIRLGDGYQASGVLSGLGTMLACYTGRWAVRLAQEVSGRFVVVRPRAADFSSDPRPYAWADYLTGWYASRPSGLARDVIDRFPDPSLRLYPQLSQPSEGDPEWSLRLDGLGVGVVRSTTGSLQVGKKETAQTATKAWAQVNGGYGAVALDAASGADQAHDVLRALVNVLGKNRSGVVKHRQPEHSLESLVVRGAAVVAVQGQRLDLLHAEGGNVPRVAWGSQTPTLWWVNGETRYLDALMRSGAVPYAVELKVKDGGGYGRYLREALTQAVLYRHFLATADAFHPWMRSLGLDPSQCRAVVGFPVPHKMTPALRARLDAFERLCAAFGVDYCEIEDTDL